MTTQNLLHHRRHVVVAQGAEHASEIIEGQFVSLQQRLLRGVRVRPVERVARGHAAHREELKLAGFPVQFRHRLKPIDLALLAPVVALRHEHFPAVEPQLPFPELHISPHGGLGDRMVGVLLAQSRPNPVRCVALLPRRFAVAQQHPVDSLFDRIQFGMLPFVLLARRRDGAGDRLAHHSSMHAMLLRQPLTVSPAA